MAAGAGAGAGAGAAVWAKALDEAAKRPATSVATSLFMVMAFWG